MNLKLSSRYRIDIIGGFNRPACNLVLSFKYKNHPEHWSEAPFDVRKLEFILSFIFLWFAVMVERNPQPSNASKKAA